MTVELPFLILLQGNWQRLFRRTGNRFRRYRENFIGVGSTECFRWSRNGRKLATASSDHTVAVSMVLTGECKHRFRLPSMVNVVQFNPVDDTKLLVCCLRYSSVVINITDETSQ